jgi:hypothetical protein
MIERPGFNTLPAGESQGRPGLPLMRSADSSYAPDAGPVGGWSGLREYNAIGSFSSTHFEPAINTPTRDALLTPPSSSRSIGGLGEESPVRTRVLPW